MPADDDEDECKGVADCDTCLVGSFKTPPGHLLQPPPEQVSNGLKGKKIAYKFEIEWEVGTFKCMYKESKQQVQGPRNCVLWQELHHVLGLRIEQIRHGSRLGNH